MLTEVKIVSDQIRAGKKLFLAGDESVLKQLPKGNWIAGTIPYFMDSEGGAVAKDRIFVNEASAESSDVKIVWYDEKALPRIPQDAFENGYSVIILPATSPAHLSFSKNAPSYPGMFMKPLIGWISGVHLSDLGKISPKVFNGLTGELSDSKGVVMHVSLPAGKLASIGIVNLFTPGAGDALTFQEEGFSVRDVFVNGAKTNFADYLKSKSIDTKLPLVANYGGTMVNISFQAVDENAKTVALYAPVFKDVEYHIATPVKDYVKEFTAAMPVGKINPVFSCNCILNFLYSSLEGKKTGSIVGPITFGEIAYQLLNQTLTYLEIKG